MEDRLYHERNLRKCVDKDLHELEKNMQDSSESDSSSSDDDSPPDTDRRQLKDGSRSKQQSQCHKNNWHKGKPCYERQHSSKNSSDKPTSKLTEKSRHDDQDCESRTVTNPHLEKAQEYLEQYGYGYEEEKTLHDKSTPTLKIRDKVEQMFLMMEVTVSIEQDLMFVILS